jgi:hypothetical protein
MRYINLDATEWKTTHDFYDALLLAIGAPKGHGRSPDALIDSMVWGGMNSVEPPYAVRISGLSATPKEVHDHVELVSGALVDGRIYRKRHNGDNVEVSIVRAPENDGSIFDDQVSEIRKAVEAVQYEGPDPRLRSIADQRRAAPPAPAARLL